VTGVTGARVVVVGAALVAGTVDDGAVEVEFGVVTTTVARVRATVPPDAWHAIIGEVAPKVAKARQRTGRTRGRR
jgi:hypothetical protein